MKHLYVTTYRVREEFQVGYDLLRFKPVALGAEAGAVVVAHYARVDGTGGFVVHDVPGQPYPHISRSNCAPAYYQGRPANLWIKVMERRRRRTADEPLARALTGDWERALSAYGGSLADARVETVCVTPTP
jgi:hypothetical protein